MKERIPSYGKCWKQKWDGVVQRTHMEELNGTGFQVHGLESIVLERHQFLGRKRGTTWKLEVSFESSSQWLKSRLLITDNHEWRTIKRLATKWYHVLKQLLFVVETKEGNLELRNQKSHFNHLLYLLHRIPLLTKILGISNIFKNKKTTSQN